MKNLAGDKDADKQIREELYLAGIEQDYEVSKGEVPFTVIGKIGKWKFTRAWYYWVAKVENREDGLPLDNAMELHHTINPIDPETILGTSIRSGGHCGCPSPDEYGAQPVYNDELNKKLIELGYEEKEFLGKKYVSITVGEMSELNRKGLIDVPFYVDSYHIDDQIGLNEFAKALNKFYSK